MYQGTESSRVLFTETLITIPVEIALYKKTTTKQYLWHRGQSWHPVGRLTAGRAVFRILWPRLTQ